MLVLSNHKRLPPNCRVVVRVEVERLLYPNRVESEIIITQTVYATEGKIAVEHRGNTMTISQDD